MHQVLLIHDFIQLSPSTPLINYGDAMARNGIQGHVPVLTEFTGFPR
jgi:hypothetical protein